MFRGKTTDTSINYSKYREATENQIEMRLNKCLSLLSDEKIDDAEDEEFKESQIQPI